MLSLFSMNNHTILYAGGIINGGFPQEDIYDLISTALYNNGIDIVDKLACTYNEVMDSMKQDPVAVVLTTKYLFDNKEQRPIPEEAFKKTLDVIELANEKSIPAFYILSTNLYGRPPYNTIARQFGAPPDWYPAKAEAKGAICLESHGNNWEDIALPIIKTIIKHLKPDSSK